MALDVEIIKSDSIKQYTLVSITNSDMLKYSLLRYFSKMLDLRLLLIYSGYTDIINSLDITRYYITPWISLPYLFSVLKRSYTQNFNLSDDTRSPANLLPGM